jgi:hypothetical protein
LYTVKNKVKKSKLLKKKDKGTFPEKYELYKTVEAHTARCDVVAKMKKPYKMLINDDICLQVII